MWSMPVVLTEWENENDSANQNDVAKMMWQCRMEIAVVLCKNHLISSCKVGTCDCALTLHSIPITQNFSFRETSQS